MPITGEEDKLSRVRQMVDIVGNLKFQDPNSEL
jgi:hypothetical protein